jgi:hypothetical protein
LLAITGIPTISVKQFRVCIALIRKPPEIDAKVLELVLKCTKNEKACYIGKLATKIGNLELKIDTQYVRRAKLGQITRKATQIKYKNGFF